VNPPYVNGKPRIVVSSNLPEFPPVYSYRYTGAPDTIPAVPDPGPSGREWAVSVLLFCVTAVTTSFAGLFYVVGDAGLGTALRATFYKPSLILQGLPFSVPLISILLAHEMGHFLACRYYGVRCTPPFFIPAPISIAGTLGAFIKIRSPFQHKRALFDIGIAGPLAGFILTLPALWIGIGLSKLIPKGALGTGGISFGEPLVFRMFGRLVLGYSPARQDMIAHPIAMAAWFGLLATSLNLLPIWQLDGGHIAYAMFGPVRQKKVSIVCVVALIMLSFLGWPTPSYLLFGLLLLIVGARLRFYHPPTLLEGEELGPGRFFLGLVALLILIIAFTPVPISIT
jgi:membrane-associated protease RseP (regulator of RpoE activity)